MYRILGKGGWQTNGLFILPWMGGMVDVCIILQTLAGGVRHPSLHCTAAVAMMVNSMQYLDGSCNATAAEPVRCRLTCRKKETHENWTIGVEMHGSRMQVCSFQRKINMHGNKHIDPMSMHKLVDRFSTKLMVLNG